MLRLLSNYYPSALHFISEDHVTSDMFFSFDVGPVHFISVSTEYLYDPTKDENWAKLQGQGAMIQYQWLVKELEKSTTEEARRYKML